MTDLSTVQQFQISQAAERLSREFAGVLNQETIERFMNDSLDHLLPRATVSQWVFLLAERFARQRLQALSRLQAVGDPDRAPAVLFLCTHNAGRSQMAAGFMRRLAGEHVDVYSGGTEPGNELNQAAVAAMAELGIDIAEEFPQAWTDEIVRAVDVVVTMGCGDACPVFPGKRYVDWDLPDPAGKPLEKVRSIRDEIRTRVEGLMAELGVRVD